MYWLCFLFILVTFIVSFVAHRELGFEMDDNWYSTNLVTGEALDSFGDVLESQVWHYHNWGGRSLTHGLLQLILWAGEDVADILNLLMTLLLAGLICKVSDAKGPLWLFSALAMMVGLNANWRMSMYLSLIKEKMKEKKYILDFVFLLKIKTGISIWSCTCLSMWVTCVSWLRVGQKPFL